MVAVGGGGGVGLGGFGVALGFRGAFDGGLFPNDFAGFAVDGVDLPLVFGDVGVGFGGAVEAGFDLCGGVGGDGGGEIDAVAEDDGGG